MGATETQICNKCSTEKPLNKYHKHSKSKNGVKKTCKVCSSKASRERYWSLTLLERQLEILAISLLGRTSGRRNKKQYYDKGIECRIGKGKAEVKDYLRKHFAEDIQNLLDRGEQVTVDRIDSAGHYEDGNIRIMSHKENSLRGSVNGIKVLSHAVTVKDLDTGEITIMPSMKATARAIGCSDRTIGRYLNSNKPIYGRYVITKEELS